MRLLVNSHLLYYAFMDAFQSIVFSIGGSPAATGGNTFLWKRLLEERIFGHKPSKDNEYRRRQERSDQTSNLIALNSGVDEHDVNIIVATHSSSFITDQFLVT